MPLNTLIIETESISEGGYELLFSSRTNVNKRDTSISNNCEEISLSIVGNHKVNIGINNILDLQEVKIGQVEHYVKFLVFIGKLVLKSD